MSWLHHSQPNLQLLAIFGNLHCRVCHTFCSAGHGNQRLQNHELTDPTQQQHSFLQSHVLCPVPVQGSAAFTGFARFSPNGALMASGGQDGAVALRPGPSMDAAARQVPVHDGGEGELAVPVSAMILQLSFWRCFRGCFVKRCRA